MRFNTSGNVALEYRLDGKQNGYFAQVRSFIELAEQGAHHA
jgi:hypothetical protein